MVKAGLIKISIIITGLVLIYLPVQAQAPKSMASGQAPKSMASGQAPKSIASGQALKSIASYQGRGSLKAAGQELVMNIQDIERVARSLEAAVDYRSEKIEKTKQLADFLSELQYDVTAQFLKVGFPKIIPAKEFPKTEVDGEKLSEQFLQLSEDVLVPFKQDFVQPEPLPDCLPGQRPGPSECIAVFFSDELLIQLIQDTVIIEEQATDTENSIKNFVEEFSKKIPDVDLGGFVTRLLKTENRQVFLGDLPERPEIKISERDVVKRILESGKSVLAPFTREFLGPRKQIPFWL